MAARHRIAVLGGGEINRRSFRSSLQAIVCDVVPGGADLLSYIAAFVADSVMGTLFRTDLPGWRTSHVHILRIAAGAELDGRAALHLRRVAGQVLAIDLQIQGLGGDGQAIDDNIVQLRAFDIIRGVPLVSAVRVRAPCIQVLVGCCRISFHCRALCQRQCADHGRISRPGEFCTLAGNDLINAGCGRVFRVAEGGGDIVAFACRLDRHCALDGVAVQVKSRVLRAVDGIIAGHVGQQLKGLRRRLCLRQGLSANQQISAAGGCPRHCSRLFQPPRARCSRGR